jgi:hypothetical protein
MSYIIYDRSQYESGKFFWEKAAASKENNPLAQTALTFDSGFQICCYVTEKRLFGSAQKALRKPNRSKPSGFNMRAIARARASAPKAR